MVRKTSKKQVTPSQGGNLITMKGRRGIDKRSLHGSRRQGGILGLNTLSHLYTGYRLYKGFNSVKNSASNFLWPKSSAPMPYKPANNIAPKSTWWGTTPENSDRIGVTKSLRQANKINNYKEAPESPAQTKSRLSKWWNGEKPTEPINLASKYPQGTNLLNQAKAPANQLHDTVTDSGVVPGLKSQGYIPGQSSIGKKAFSSIINKKGNVKPIKLTDKQIKSSIQEHEASQPLQMDNPYLSEGEWFGDAQGNGKTGGVISDPIHIEKKRIRRPYTREQIDKIYDRERNGYSS
jgi:hypothetical protein